MKKSSLAWTMRGISLLVGLVGVWMVLRSTELGLSQADTLTSNREEFSSSTRFWLVQQSGIAAYRTLGAVLAGVGLFQALRPLQPIELSRFTFDEESDSRRSSETSTPSPVGLTKSNPVVDQQPRQDRAIRKISASSQKIYWALVDPDVLVRWLPPEGMRGRIEKFEPQVGGAYRMVLTYPSGSPNVGKSTTDTDIVEGRFVELVPGERIVQAVRFDSPDPSFAGEMRMTWTLEAASNGDGTIVTVSCDQVPNGIGKKEHEQSLDSTLRNLERIVS
ncbi:SRPBCC domain-containing protein [Saccharibacillus sp. JS10]|uniref:SRPBCC domain-containing protein n=1 Tax=Saccharibacillus sp. JS10 TaxID=2950552 RepID=UPI00210878C9|nr:SRPBCC domain-containing protein [Saccharibacillus sp. JS10]MCQ4088380.1 SRPBCC domain-containing protein [Saccharibacillus sp. JS10]